MKEVLGIISKIISENSQAIWTIVSMVIGSIISFSASYRLENKKHKIKMKKENLDKVLIPYCTDLERLIKYYKDNKINDLQEWRGFTRKPLEYLDASKRVYLTKKSKKLLEEYNQLLVDLNKNIKQSYKNFKSEYNEYIESLLLKYPGIPYADKLHISIEKETRDDIKLALINKQSLSIIFKITCISFDNYNDEGFIINPNFYIQISDEIKEEWQLEYDGYIKRDKNKDIIDPERAYEREVTYAVLDCFDKNYIEENIKVKEMLNRVEISDSVEKLYKKVSYMRKQIIREIDKITK